MVATGRGATHGVLFRDAAAIENLRRVDTLIRRQDRHAHRRPACSSPYPLTGWLLSPMIAALTMSLSSASVIGNALRLRTGQQGPALPE